MTITKIHLSVCACLSSLITSSNLNFISHHPHSYMYTQIQIQTLYIIIIAIKSNTCTYLIQCGLSEERGRKRRRWWSGKEREKEEEKDEMVWRRRGSMGSRCYQYQL